MTSRYRAHVTTGAGINGQYRTFTGPCTLSYSSIPNFIARYTPNCSLIRKKMRSDLNCTSIHISTDSSPSYL